MTHQEQPQWILAKTSLVVIYTVLKFRGTRGNTVPVRKLQPHLGGTFGPFKTHGPQSLSQKISSSGAFCSVSSVCSHYSSWLTAMCESEFPCFSAIPQSDYAPMHDNQLDTVIKDH